MEKRERGCIKWFSAKKGFGFIERALGADLFVHHSAIHTTAVETKKNSLTANDWVEFVVRQGEKGLQAEEVKKVQSA